MQWQVAASRWRRQAASLTWRGPKQRSGGPKQPWVGAAWPTRWRRPWSKCARVCAWARSAQGRHAGEIRSGGYPAWAWWDQCGLALVIFLFYGKIVGECRIWHSANSLSSAPSAALDKRPFADKTCCRESFLPSVDSLVVSSWTRMDYHSMRKSVAAVLPRGLQMAIMELPVRRKNPKKDATPAEAMLLIKELLLLAFAIMAGNGIY